MAIRRCSYRRSNQADNVELKTVEVPLSDSFQRALDALVDYYAEVLGMHVTRRSIARELFECALVNSFETITRKRIGEWDADLTAGREFEWRRLPGGRVVLAEIRESVQ